MDQQLEPWECELLASHERVRKNDTVILTVVLSHPLIGAIDPADVEFYRDFDYKYNAHDEMVCFPEQNPSVLRMPSLPHGSLRADVRVTLNNAHGLRAWFAKYENERSSDLPEGRWEALRECLIADTSPPHALHASNTLSIVTHPLDVHATVNLQPSAISLTDDAVLGVAIRNRTAAVGFDRYKRFLDCLFCGDDLSGVRASKLSKQAYNPSLSDVWTNSATNLQALTLGSTFMALTRTAF